MRFGFPLQPIDAPLAPERPGHPERTEPEVHERGRVHMVPTAPQLDPAPLDLRPEPPGPERSHSPAQPLAFRRNQIESRFTTTRFVLISRMYSTPPMSTAAVPRTWNRVQKVRTIPTMSRTSPAVIPPYAVRNRRGVMA